MATDDVPDLSHLLEGDFDSQVKLILENVRLARNEVENLSSLFQDLEQTLQSFWPGCKVLPFGSIITGLGITTSDADCYVDLPDEYLRPGDKYVMTAKHILMRHPLRFRELFAITSAKVPIVKFFHAPTQRHCDVNFSSLAGVRNSQLVANLFQMDKRALPLAVLVKYWSKVHRLTGTNLVPNYTLTMMVISYLQHVKILPAVRQLQKFQQPIMVDYWDTNFNINYSHKTTNDQGLYDLLGGFFEYYSSYNFKEEILSPFLAQSFSNKLFTNLDTVPNEFKLYKLNIRNNLCRHLKTDTSMCVQDVFDHSRNTAVSIYPRLAVTFITYIQYCANRYRDTSADDFLKAILNVKLPPQALPQKPGKKHMRKAVHKKIKHKVGVPKRRHVQIRNIQNYFVELNRLKKNKNRGNRNEYVLW